MAMDWDDNILHMPTVIHMDNLVDGNWIPVDVSTADFAKVRVDKENWRMRNESATEAFCEFRDFGPRGRDAFIDDVKISISEGEFGPSWDAFIECLSNGIIFSIITARGHEPETLKRGVEYIIDNVLSSEEKQSLYSHCIKFSYLFNSDYDSYDRIAKGKLSQTRLITDYLNECEFFGVSSTTFINKFKLGDASNPELAKELALKFFTDKINDFGKKVGAKSISLGFSDDDIRNVNHVEKVFRNELSLKYAMKYNIYNTSDRSIKGGIRTKIHPEEPNPIISESAFGNGDSNWGMESSVLPFTKWNNMTQKFYPSSDNTLDDRHNFFKNEIGQLKDLTDKKKVLRDVKRKK